MLKSFKSSKLIAGGKGHSHPNHGVSKSKTKIESFYTDDADYHAQLDRMRDEIADLQTILYAEKRQALLIIFQGMDTAGKDSAIKHVMSGLNPSSTTVAAFAKPNEEELAHDFLWRTHKRLPSRGKIGIFNRSYYEEVTTVRVHPEYLEGEHLPRRVKFDDRFWSHRLEDIRQHEAYLERQGINVVKFFLHISKEEQRQRLLSRIVETEKNWKFDISDVQERKLWNQYHDAYDEALRVTSTDDSPWYVIPGDDKKNARLMICHIVIEQLRALKSDYPKVSTEKQRQLSKIERELEKE